MAAASTTAMATATTEEVDSDSCECCGKTCTDADREKWSRRFESFKDEREADWDELKVTNPSLQPGIFPFTRLPRELRDSIYHLLLGPKTHYGAKYVKRDNDHLFPTQILHLNKQIRDEFLDEMFDRIYAMCQYSSHPNYIEILLPPSTLFPRIKRLEVCLILSEYKHSSMPTPLPSWSQVLADTQLLVDMFPALRAASLKFLREFATHKEMDEMDVEGVWDKAGLRNVSAVWKVKFKLRGPISGVPTMQSVNHWTFVRESTGSPEWEVRKKTERYRVVNLAASVGL